jgi:hypothetical protein
MFNAAGSPQDFDPYSDLQKRVLQRLHVAKVEDRILKVVRTAYEDALVAENLVLSRAENKRLLALVLKSVLDGMLQQLGHGSTPV